MFPRRYDRVGVVPYATIPFPSDAERGTIVVTRLNNQCTKPGRRKGKDHARFGWCREGEFIFGDPIFPITLAKLPRSSGLANDRTLLIFPI